MSNSHSSRVLPTPAGPETATRRAALALERTVEELLEQTQVGVASEQRRLEDPLALRAAHTGDHAHGPPQMQRLGLALHRVLAGVLVGDRRRGHFVGDLVHEHRPRPGRRLGAGRRVHAIADDQAFAGVGHRRDLPGGDPRPRPQLGDADLLTEGGHRVHQLEPGPHRSLGVILARHRHAPHRHHRVAYELFGGAGVAVDDLACRVEVAAEQLAHLLGIAALRQRGVADEVDEQHRHEAQLRRARRQLERGGWRGHGRLHSVQRRSALSAEPLVGGMLGAAGPAALHQRGPALDAELRALRDLRLTRRADHFSSS